MSKILADISVELWTALRKAGLKASVQCSKRSLSRYVVVKGCFRIRLSDHTVTPGNIRADYEIIATRSDNLAKKMAEARKLAEQLVGEFSAFATES